MPNHNGLSRYTTILSTLKLQKFPTLNDLLDKINASEVKKIAERTLQRDFVELENLGIKISYSKTQKGYFIDNEQSTHHVSSLNYLLEAQEKVDILLENKSLLAQNNAKIHFEKNNIDSENINLKQIINALHKNKALYVVYKTFENNESKTYEVIPLFLKQHKNRFYLVSKRILDERIITFSLDRIGSLAYCGD